MVEGTPTAAGYPVTYDVEAQIADRNRLTVAFRIILGIPQWLLVGGPGGSGISLSWVWRWGVPSLILPRSIGSGVLGLVAAVMAIISWFAIVFTGKQPRGLWDFTNFFMRWRGNAGALRPSA